MDEFDGILDGEDMLVFGAVQIVDHGRQGRRFARAGWPGDQYQSTWHIGNFLEHIAHAQLFHGQYLGGNGPEHRTRTAVLVEGVNPETGHTGHLE